MILKRMPSWLQFILPFSRAKQRGEDVHHVKSLFFVRRGSGNKEGGRGKKERKQASKAVIWNSQLCSNNKGNLLCTSTEPQQRSDGGSRPQTFQMDAECLGVTVDCTLNTVHSEKRIGPLSGVTLTSLLHRIIPLGGFRPPKPLPQRRVRVKNFSFTSFA